jgi:RNA polymerase sigma-70 factor (ECF subfamily)
MRIQERLVPPADDGPHLVPISFEAFYRSEYRKVAGLVYAVTHSRTACEDIAQEAFLRAHRDWATVSRYESPRAWVRTVALNLARSGFRKMAAEARAMGRLVGLSKPALPELEPASESFWKSVAALPRRQREVVALHYLEDRPVAEVAAMLGIAESSVKNSLAQARARLARSLEVEL